MGLIARIALGVAGRLSAALLLSGKYQEASSWNSPGFRLIIPFVDVRPPAADGRLVRVAAADAS